MNNSKRNLERLSKYLTLNYINASIEGEKEDGSEKIDEEVIKEVANVNFAHNGSDAEFERYARVLLIVGAGMSYNAFKDIPLAEQAIDILYKKFSFGQKDNGEEVTFYSIIHSDIDDLINEGHKSLHRKYKEEYNKLQLYNSYKNPSNKIDFETSLALLTHFFPTSEIRDHLREIYSRRFGPTLYHDIISHLFKHRFIDIIINFNFDELLDQSIKDELGSNSYISILSDGDCRPMEELLISKRLKQPIYIKPHGTYSHKSTMRFTKDQYDQLPYDMKRLLEDVVICEKDIGLAQSPILIVVGFALSSIEFNEVLAKIPGKFVIYYFYYNEYEKAEKLIAEITENRCVFLPICIQDFQGGETNEPEYDLVFEQLWTSINEKFIDHFKPRNIKRHKIIQMIFGAPDFWSAIKEESKFNGCKEYFRSAEYFRDRAVVEIVLESFKLNQQVSIEYLLNAKPGYYFSKYYFANSAQDDENTLSFIELLEAINFNVDYIENICIMPNHFDDKVILLSNVLSKEVKTQILKNHKLLLEYVEDFKSSRKSVIATDYRSRFYLVYNKYATHQLLTTNLSLEYQLMKRFKEKWTHLLIVEDSGLTLELYQDYINKNIDNVTVILANRSDYYDNDEAQTTLFLKLIKSKLSPLLFLPSGSHDHHMTIFINVNTSKMESIYYFQKGLSNTFSPIEISEKKNLKTLLRIFKKYFDEACNYSKVDQFDFDQEKILEVLK